MGMLTSFAEKGGVGLSSQNTNFGRESSKNPLPKTHSA
jgi:hypothetical protein